MSWRRSEGAQKPAQKQTARQRNPLKVAPSHLFELKVTERHFVEPMRNILFRNYQLIYIKNLL